MTKEGYALEYGWPNDGGIGEMLIGQTIRGEKTATCGFKRAFTEQEIAEEYGVVGHDVPVKDSAGMIRCYAHIIEVFETTFGDPDPRLVAGEGDGEDVTKFQDDHRIAWQADFGDAELSDDEPLIVMLFEPAEGCESYQSDDSTT